MHVHYKCFVILHLICRGQLLGRTEKKDQGGEGHAVLPTVHGQEENRKRNREDGVSVSESVCGSFAS